MSSLRELTQLQKMLEEELTGLQSNLNKLKLAQTRFQNSLNSLAGLKPANKGQTALVPLTQSLYVTARQDNVETVLVDIGTGYHVRKTIPEAKKFFDRKIDAIKSNIAKVQAIATDKSRQLDNATVAIQSQLFAIQAAQAQGK